MEHRRIGKGCIRQKFEKKWLGSWGKENKGRNEKIKIVDPSGNCGQWETNRYQSDENDERKRWLNLVFETNDWEWKKVKSSNRQGLWAEKVGDLKIKARIDIVREKNSKRRN